MRMRPRPLRSPRPAKEGGPWQRSSATSPVRSSPGWQPSRSLLAAHMRVGMQRRTGILLTAAAMGTVVAGATPLAGADTAGGANNVVLVNNTVDGATAARSHLSVAHDPADTVANQNIASATGNDCNGCR